MNVLLDYISLQGYINGGAIYVLQIYKKLYCKYPNVKYYGIFDSKQSFIFQGLDDKVELIDIKKHDLAQIIISYNIDVFFIGIGQRFNSYKLDGITCRTICVIHDVGDIEYFYNKYDSILNVDIKSRILNVLNIFSNNLSTTIRLYILKKKYTNIIRFIANENVSLITVSYHTAQSIRFFFPEIEKKTIKIYYPPFEHIIDDVESPIKDLKGKQFLLLLNIGRANKNPKTIIKAFSRLSSEYPNVYLATTGGTVKGKNILCLKGVEKSQMSWLYKNALLLIYPSVNEGFGYPPLEAMKYGTPTICSNISPLNDIYGDSVIQFTPFNVNEIYYKLVDFLEGRYSDVSNKSKETYKRILKESEHDTSTLLNLITESDEVK